MKVKNKKLLAMWIRNNSMIIILFGVMIFPIIVGVFYALPLPQIIAIGSGDFLAYYGTIFGIIGSFVTYRYEVNKDKKERNNELKPIFVVEVSMENEYTGLFDIKITNLVEQPLSFFYLYDEFVSSAIQKKNEFKVTFCKSIEEIEEIEPDYNITMDRDIIDSDGYPRYVQILCDDRDGNIWNCCYNKVKDCDKVYYYPRNFEII